MLPHRVGVLAVRSLERRLVMLPGVGLVFTPPDVPAGNGGCTVSHKTGFAFSIQWGGAGEDFHGPTC